MIQISYQSQSCFPCTHFYEYLTTCIEIEETNLSLWMEICCCSMREWHIRQTEERRWASISWFKHFTTQRTNFWEFKNFTHSSATLRNSFEIITWMINKRFINLHHFTFYHCIFRRSKLLFFIFHYIYLIHDYKVINLFILMVISLEGMCLHAIFTTESSSSLLSLSLSLLDSNTPAGRCGRSVLSTDKKSAASLTLKLSNKQNIPD